MNMPTLHKVYNLIILDESGSMNTIKEQTIRGFNEVVQTIKHVEKQFPDQKHFINLITFNGAGIKEVLVLKEITGLNELTENMYKPYSSTPLYDAIGEGINKLNSVINNGEDYTVLVTIITDGEENSSKEYSGRQIKVLIEKLSEEGWTFSYIGANHDVIRSAASLSITNTLEFKSESKSVADMFDKEKKARVKLSQHIDIHNKIKFDKDSKFSFNKDLYKDDE